VSVAVFRGQEVQEGLPLRIELANEAEKIGRGGRNGSAFYSREGDAWAREAEDREISSTTLQLDKFSAVVASRAVHALMAGDTRTQRWWLGRFDELSVSHSATSLPPTAVNKAVPARLEVVSCQKRLEQASWDYPGG
jgi:hypothetical protein